jgi:hypothetical protein
LLQKYKEIFIKHTDIARKWFIFYDWVEDHIFLPTPRFKGFWNFVYRCWELKIVFAQSYNKLINKYISFCVVLEENYLDKNALVLPNIELPDFWYNRLYYWFKRTSPDKIRQMPWFIWFKNYDIFYLDNFTNSCWFKKVMLWIKLILFNEDGFRYRIPKKIKKCIRYTLYTFVNNKWYFDVIYNEYINKPLLKNAYKTIFSSIDKGCLEIFGPLGFSKFFKLFAFEIKRMHIGQVYYYSYFLIIYLLVNLAIIISLF